MGSTKHWNLQKEIVEREMFIPFKYGSHLWGVKISTLNQVLIQTILLRNIDTWLTRAVQQSMNSGSTHICSIIGILMLNHVTWLVVFDWTLFSVTLW